MGLFSASLLQNERDFIRFSATKICATHNTISQFFVDFKKFSQ